MVVGGGATILRPATGVRAFVVAIIVVGDLAFVLIPLLVASSAGLLIGFEVFTLACAAGLTWFLLRLVNARVVIGAGEVTIHSFMPRPIVVPRAEISRVATGRSAGGQGSWSPVLHLRNGSAVPVTVLAAKSERAAEAGTGRLNQALSGA
jgi:hypothetical protein